MFLEAVVTREDLRALLAEALPLTLVLGEPGSEHTLAFSDLQEVELVADAGLRVLCRAHVRWPVLGIEVPIALNSLRALITPVIKSGPGGDALAFRLVIEHADFTAVPTAIDNRLTDAINENLAQRELDLSWDFTKALSHVLPLPEAMVPLDALTTRVAWGKVKITTDALVLAVSVHTNFVRRDPASSRASAPAEAPSRPLSTRTKPTARLATLSEEAKVIALAGIFGVAAGATYFGFRSMLRGRS
jgi:hypothetical protein